MTSSEVLKAYQQTSVNTASKEKLLLMLLDGLVRFINQGIAGIETKNIQQANINIIKAQNIVLELLSTLNKNANPELYKSLSALYDYMYRRLVDANIKKDASIAREVLVFAVELKETFEEAYKIINKK